LLVLDNFEQVTAAAPFVGALLASCPALKLLVTSRATLHLYDEHEFPVPPLALPILESQSELDSSKIKNPKSTIDVEVLAQVPAVALFVQRALAAKPDFALTTGNAAAVAEICIGLDGLPLAIELAAARIKMFSPPALLAGLKQRLTLLTGGPHDLPARQRTLRDEIGWSYNLLTKSEQALFRRLAVFAGGFTLEAAQAVGNATGEPGIDLLNGVTSLVDQSLLKQVGQSNSEPRFAMLETVREYGLEQLATCGEMETIRRRHAHFFLALAEATEPHLRGAGWEQALAQVEIELDNLRATVAWSLTPPPLDDTHRAGVGLRLAAALIWFAWNNHLSEVRGWLEATLQQTTEPTAIRAKALWGAGLIAVVHGDYQIARSELEESVALWRKFGDPRGLADALRELCLVAYAQHDFSAAQQYGEESVSLWRVVGSQVDLGLALESLGFAHAAQGDHATARRLFEEEYALFQALDRKGGLAGALIGLGWLAGQQRDDATARTHFEHALAILPLRDTWVIADALRLLGEVHQRQGELEQAGQRYREGLVVAREVGDKGAVGLLLHLLGALAHAHTQVERAACLFAVAARLRTLSRGVLSHTFTTPADQERDIAMLRAETAEETFTTNWARGEAMTLDQAIEYALAPVEGQEPAPSPVEYNSVMPSPPAPAPPAGLTAREVEVLRLMALGHSYTEIAGHLVISPRTVNAHVTSIFSKLGVTSRAAATRIAIDHHLA
jgi:predicted ATPase/DNA-binding CsgD family transcriptional regulator